jgi:hypothetical protein
MRFSLIFSLFLLTIAVLMSPISANEHGSSATARDAGGSKLITDFTSAGEDLGWYVVNDNVMGGRSDGGFDVSDGELRFAGQTNTRGGGFSSIRSKSLGLDLSNQDGIRLRVKGDGRRYTWRLTTRATAYGRPIAYWADFDTAAGAWQSIDVPFSRFVPRFRGEELDGPALNTSEITGMGLMIYDKRDGPFEAVLKSVYAYAHGQGAPFSLAELRWDRRVLVLNAPDANDEALRVQLGLVGSSEAEFVERDLLLVTLLDDSNSSAGNRRLTRDEVERARAELGIEGSEFAVLLMGKDGGVKLSRSEVVPMEAVYALIDGMPMRRREIQEGTGSDP